MNLVELDSALRKLRLPAWPPPSTPACAKPNRRSRPLSISCPRW